MYGSSSYGSVEYGGERPPAGGLLLDLREHVHMSALFFKGILLPAFLEHLHAHALAFPIRVYLVDLFDHIHAAITNFSIRHIFHVIISTSVHLRDKVQKLTLKNLVEIVTVTDDKRQTDMIYFLRTHLNVLHPRGAERPIQAIGKGDPNSF